MRQHQRKRPSGHSAMATDPQRAVSRARAQVLAGRGPGAEQAETDRHKRERPTLGPFPAPLERELVHLNTTAFRSNSAPDVDETAVQNQRDRLQGVWDRPAPPRTASRTRFAAAAGFVLGATIAWVVARSDHRSQ